MFSTIIKKETGDVYHGHILNWEGDDYFTFGFRIDGKNYIWKCGLDYWTLII